VKFRKLLPRLITILLKGSPLVRAFNKKIELKVEDSKNEIVQLLMMIKKFNDENAMEFGETQLIFVW